MFDIINTAETSAFVAETAATSSAANTTTKGELLERARAAIEAGEQSLHDAAEALALAQEDFGATQREIATAVGRSVSWVNRLLKWRQSGYEDNSPFGPTTTAGRVSHAKQRTKASKAHKAGVEGSVDDDSPDTSAERRKAEYAKEEESPASTVTGPLAGFKSAVNYWFPRMDCNAKREAVNYAIAQSKVEVSCPT
jgi:hypothetical protein